jgi:RNA polymerase subunit RPABC4/transcription elongation factor Spt4
VFLLYCIHCGNKISEKTNFCPVCGNKAFDKTITDEKKETKVIYDQSKTATFGRKSVPINNSSSLGSNQSGYTSIFAPKGSVIDRLKSAYSKTLWFFMALLGYGFIGLIILNTGLDVMFNQSIGLGLLLTLVGVLVLMVSYFAAFLYALAKARFINELGFFEAFFTTVKLFIELLLVVIVGYILMTAGTSLGGDLGLLFLIGGIVLLMMLPIAAQFYMIEYVMINRKHGNSN